MAIRIIREEGDEILRKKSREVDIVDDRIKELLNDMIETMHKYNGVGLAAVQVGVLKRVIIIEANNMFMELINPVIIAQSGEDIEQEGCLSVGKDYDYVKRPMYVTVRAQDRFGYDFCISGEKYLARVLCHEIDHLDGVLFIDKIEKGYKEKK